KAAHMTNRTGAPSFVLGTDGLRRIFDHNQIVALGHVHDWVHVSHLSKQVDGDNSLRAWRNGSLDLAGVDVVSAWVNFHKNRLGPQTSDTTSCGKKGVRCSDDLITRL